MFLPKEERSNNNLMVAFSANTSLPVELISMKHSLLHPPGRTLSDDTNFDPEHPAGTAPIEVTHTRTQTNEII